MAIVSIFVRLRLPRQQPEEGDDTMTDDRIALRALIENAPEADFLREMIDERVKAFLLSKATGPICGWTPPPSR